MHYQVALSLLMKEQQISIETLSKRTNSSVRWLTIVLNNSDWNPCLNTVLRLSKALRVNAITFIEYAETCKQQEILRTTACNISPDQISFALKAFRLEKGISQNTLVKLTHFQLTAISLREQTRYQSYPTLCTLEIYCKAYGITVSSFLRYASSLSLSSEEALS